MARCKRCDSPKEHHDYLHSTHPFELEDAAPAERPEFDMSMHPEIVKGLITTELATEQVGAEQWTADDIVEMAYRILGHRGYYSGSELTKIAKAYAAHVTKGLEAAHKAKVKDLIAQGLKQIQAAEARNVELTGELERARKTHDEEGRTWSLLHGDLQRRLAEAEKALREAQKK